MSKITIKNRLNKVVMNSINRLLDKKGWQLVKKSYFNEKLYELLKNDDFFFVQVGAHDGVRFDDLYVKVTAHKIGGGIVIEPLKKYFKRLAMNYEDYPNIIPLNIALHPSKKEIELHHVDFDKTTLLEPWSGGIGSVDRNHHNKSGIEVEYMTKSLVKCIDFTTLINQYNIKKIDLLQIDVEGFDLEILKMVDFNKIKPKLVKYEHVNLQLNEREEAENLLKQYGYSIYIENTDTIGILSDT